jgi:hypothetical protein
MKTYRLYYDDECPLCVAYTSWFVKFRFLAPEVRLPYSTINNESITALDKERARNEIALVNTQTREVKYGIDSLVEILNQKLPFVKPISNFPPIYFLLVQLYKFISYNRKVIVGANVCNQGSCSPDFNYPYRFAFILFSVVVSSFILNVYTQHLHSFLPGASITRELLICFGQIAFQFLMGLIFIKSSEMRLHYLGNMMTISLIGSFLLLPLIILNQVFAFPDGIFLIYFGCVVTYMLWLHVKRVQQLMVSGLLSLTWVLYRLLVLLVIYMFIL